MKRIVTIELSCAYEFDEKECPKNRFADDDIANIAYDWFTECNPDIFIDEEREEN